MYSCDFPRAGRFLIDGSLARRRFAQQIRRELRQHFAQAVIGQVRLQQSGIANFETAAANREETGLALSVDKFDQPEAFYALFEKAEIVGYLLQLRRCRYFFRAGGEYIDALITLDIDQRAQLVNLHLALGTAGN